MFNDIITVYQKVVDGSNEMYKRHIFKNVYVDNIRGSSLNKNDTKNTDNLTVIIPLSKKRIIKYKYQLIFTGSLICLGETPEIKRAKDLNGYNALTVISINTLDFDSDMACLEVTAK